MGVKRSAPLTKPEIFSAALAIIDAEGIEGDGVPTVEFTEESFARAVRALMDGYGHRT